MRRRRRPDSRIAAEEFFMKRLDNENIKMAVFREKPETLEAAYENALADGKLRHRV